MRYKVNHYKVKLVRNGYAYYSPDKVESYDQAVELVKTRLKNKAKEEVLAIYLDGRNNITGVETIAMGGMHGAALTPRDIFVGAIVANASGIILAHCHPSADPTPSGEDIKLTKLATEAGKILGIDILDHIVVACRTGATYSIRNLIDMG